MRWFTRFFVTLPSILVGFLVSNYLTDDNRVVFASVVITFVVLLILTSRVQSEIESNLYDEDQENGEKHGF